jgi:hypothetical protein
MKLRWPIAVVAALMFAPACATADGSGHHKKAHHVVTVDAMEVHPPVLEIAQDQVVVWANYSGRAIQVRFPAEVASKFTCPTRPKFYRSGDGGLLSRPVNSMEFSLPCTLEPGEYEYSILGLFVDAEGVAEPGRQTPGDPKGKIVVK